MQHRHAPALADYRYFVCGDILVDNESIIRLVATLACNFIFTQSYMKGIISC